LLLTYLAALPRGPHLALARGAALAALQKPSRWSGDRAFHSETLSTSFCVNAVIHCSESTSCVHHMYPGISQIFIIIIIIIIRSSVTAAARAAADGLSSNGNSHIATVTAASRPHRRLL